MIYSILKLIWYLDPQKHLSKSFKQYFWIPKADHFYTQKAWIAVFLLHNTSSNVYEIGGDRTMSTDTLGIPNSYKKDVYQIWSVALKDFDFDWRS